MAVPCKTRIGKVTRKVNIKTKERKSRYIDRKRGEKEMKLFGFRIQCRRKQKMSEKIEEKRLRRNIEEKKK